MPKRTLPVLPGDRVLLRPLAYEDLPDTLAWRNQDQIRKWFFYSEPITWEQHLTWWEVYQDRDDDFVFVIVDLETKQSVGQIAIYHIDWDQRTGEYGRLMIGAPSARGKGFARSATDALLAFCFGVLNLNKIYLEVFSDNLPAVHLYRSVGFQEEPAQKEGVLAMALHARQNP